MPRGAPAVTARAGGARRRQHRQTLTRARPLRRRAARTARPARVRMRSRNPCVFARRRLFGWNVRLLTGTPGTQAGRVSAGTLQHAAPVSGHGEQNPAAGRAKRKVCGPGTSGQTAPGSLPPAVAPRHCCASPPARHHPTAGLRHPPPPVRHSRVTPPPPRIRPADRTGSRWHPPQHLAFAKRVPNPTPRLWTSDPGRGDPGSGDRRVRDFHDERGGCRTDVYVHNLWINLLISMWGREVDGQ